jgi:hypothetical protein
MEIRLELFSKVSCLIGLEYRSGKGFTKDNEVTFHEIGIGLFFITLYLTWY